MISTGQAFGELYVRAEVGAGPWKIRRLRECFDIANQRGSL